MTGKTIHIDARTPEDQAVAILKALANETRMAVLRHLGSRVLPVNRIASDLRLPSSTATMHIAILERAGLLHTEMRPAVRGLQKVCARTYDELVIDLPRGAQQSRARVEQSVPIGGYSEYDVEPTCGLAGLNGLIGFLDDPASFYEPGRLNAGLIWFRSGYLEYRLPNRVPPLARVASIQLSAEVCSEAPLHDLDWPSDISVWINDVHLGAWTAPGDFGGERGRFTPAWWEEKDTQYGVLKRWRVSSAGTTIDGMPLSSVRVEELGIEGSAPIRIRLGVASDGVHVGGVNLFGRGFGNYPQDLVVTTEFEPRGGGGRGDGSEPLGRLTRERSVATRSG